MSNDLIQRLRVPMNRSLCPQQTNLEAADKIESQAQRIADLEEGCDRLHEYISIKDKRIAELEDENKELREEVRRMLVAWESVEMTVKHMSEDARRKGPSL